MSHPAEVEAWKDEATRLRRAYATQLDSFANLGEDYARLEEFVRWLVSMDDPEDVIGRAERQTVTLTKIIDRAREALGEDA